MANIINETNRLVYNLVKTYMKEKSDSRAYILDNGCDGARAEITQVLLDAGQHFFGIDIDHNEILNKKIYFMNNQNLKLACADSLFLPFKNETFDIIIMLEVLEHLKDIHLAVKESFRCLKKNGKFILSTPNAYGVWTIISERIYPSLKKIFGQKARNKGYLSHVSLTGYDSLKFILQSANFTVDKTFSPYGLGFINSLNAILNKIKSGIFDNTKFSNRPLINEFLLPLELIFSSWFPIRFHSAWVIVNKKI